MTGIVDQRYKNFFLYTPEPMLFFNDQHIVDVNPALLSLLGYGSDELLRGKAINEFVLCGERAFYEHLDHEQHVQCLKSDGGRLTASVRVRHIESDLFLASFSSVADLSDGSPIAISSILDAAVDTVITINESSIIEAVYGAVESMLGYSSEELIGQSVTMLMPESFRVSHETNVKRYLETGEAKVVGIGREAMALRKDGSTFPVHLAVGETIMQGKRYFTGFIRDITQLKNAESKLYKSEELFRATFQTATYGMALIDTKGYWVSINQALSNMLGYNMKELAGSDLLSIVHQDDFTELSSNINDLLQGRAISFQVELRFCHKNGHTIWCVLSLCAVRDRHDAPIYYVAQMVNISSQKHSEALLIQAKDEAERASLAKSEFLSSMSHEIRTPLNAILGLSELVRLEENLNDQQLIDMKEIEKAGQHLLALITDILDLARIESGRLELSFESVQVDSLLNECFKLMETKIKERGISLTYEYGTCKSIMLHADRLRLKQVILNLLSNSVKYNRTDGEIFVFLTKLDDGRLRISIRDTGMGISEENMKNLFQPFNRLSMENSGIEGTGIGLVITKNIIDKMGGCLGFESQEGIGSTFWLDVNLADTHAYAHQQDDEVSSQGRMIGTSDVQNKIKVLVVEDNPQNRRVLQQQLTILGVDADTVANGKDGVAKWRTHSYDAIITDIAMTEMSGFELTRMIRSLEHAASVHIPIIAISANALPSEVEKYHDAGMDGYLVKPVNIEPLKQALVEFFPDLPIADNNVIVYPVQPGN